MYNTLYIYKKLVDGKPFVVRKNVFEQDGKQKIEYIDKKNLKHVEDFNLSMVKYIVDVETLRHGQERRYGDSYYDYNLKATNEEGKFISDKELMEHIIRTCIDSRYDERVAGNVWYLGKGSLTYKNDHWFYSYVEPYLD